MKGILSLSSRSSAKASRKLLKPEVERLRRERINSSLERLRVILLHWPEHQGLVSKRVEKAEILEHTVEFLNGYDEKQGGEEEQHFQDGYTTCLQKAADFMRQTCLNGNQRENEAQVRAFADQLTHLDRCIGSPAPTLHLTRCWATPDLCPTQYQLARLLAFQGQRHSSKSKVSPRSHSAKILSPPSLTVSPYGDLGPD